MHNNDNKIDVVSLIRKHLENVTGQVIAHGHYTKEKHLMWQDRLFLEINGIKYNENDTTENEKLYHCTCTLEQVSDVNYGLLGIDIVKFSKTQLDGPWEALSVYKGDKASLMVTFLMTIVEKTNEQSVTIVEVNEKIEGYIRER